jgi:ABC-2 type transport system permease protein
VDEQAIAGSSASLDVFGVEVAVVISLMFVTLLLAAGMLALEREEHAFGRLVRGLVSRTGLLVEKIGLAGLCAWALASVMLAVLVGFLDLGWSRTPAWLLALAFAAVAFAALGVAIGGLTREVRAASLLAFMLALPIAALALVPSGAVNTTLYDVIRIVSGAFPFKPALDALDAALSGGTLVTPLLHLAALTLAFGAIARVALRRFG